MNSKHINSGSAVKIMLEEEITTMPDPWRCRVLTGPICIPAGSVQEDCSGMAECNTENVSRSMHENRAAFTPWDRSCSVMVWLYFHLLWIKVSPARNLLQLFLTAEEDKMPRERNAHSQKQGGKKKVVPAVHVYSLGTQQGRCNADLYHSETREDKQNVTQGGDGRLPIVLAAGGSLLQTSVGILPGKEPSTERNVETVILCSSSSVKYFLIPHSAVLETI